MDEFNSLMDAVNSGLNASQYSNTFESFAEAEAFENYVMQQMKVARPQAKQVVQKIQNAGQLNTLRSQIQKTSPLGLTKVGGPSDMVGQFDINATRLTNNIAAPLPVVFFSPQMLESNYNQVIQLGAGITLAITGGYQSGKPDRFDFTYTSGADVDTIEVTTGDSALQYPSFMSACQTDKFTASKMRYIVPDESAASLAQFKNSLQFFRATTFGKVESNKLSANSFRNPQNFQKNILDINGTYSFDKSKGLWMNINPEANFQVTLSMFLEFTYQDTFKA